MTTGTTPKPRSPRRSRSPPSNPNRLIAPNTPAEGIRRPLEDSTTARSQTPDARGASPEEEDVNAIPTKGPLRVRKDTIAAKKRANQIREDAKAREAARTRLPTGETVQRARRSARPNIPQPGAMAISPETSIPSQQQMPTDEEEADTESDTARRRRRRSNSANKASSSSEQNSDREPSQENGRGRVRRSLTTSSFVLSNTWRLTVPQDLKYLFTNPKVKVNLKTYCDPTRSGSSFYDLS
jgi:hypothetical protein